MANTVDDQGWPPESTLDAGDASEDNASGLYDTPGQRWYECDRCGFLYPEEDTIEEEYSGLRVCTVIPCYDEPNSDDFRNMGISRIFPGEEEF